MDSVWVSVWGFWGFGVGLGGLWTSVWGLGFGRGTYFVTSLQRGEGLGETGRGRAQGGKRHGGGLGGGVGLKACGGSVVF